MRQDIAIRILIYMLLISILPPLSTHATSFPRPTTEDYDHVVETGHWIRNALAERNEAISGNTNNNPIATSQYNFSITAKTSVMSITPLFITVTNATQTTNSNYDFTDYLRGEDEGQARISLPKWSASDLLSHCNVPDNGFVPLDLITNMFSQLVLLPSDNERQLVGNYTDYWTDRNVCQEGDLTDVVDELLAIDNFDNVWTNEYPDALPYVHASFWEVVALKLKGVPPTERSEYSIESRVDYILSYTNISIDSKSPFTADLYYVKDLPNRVTIGTDFAYIKTSACWTNLDGCSRTFDWLADHYPITIEAEITDNSMIGFFDSHELTIFSTNVPFGTPDNYPRYQRVSGSFSSVNLDYFVDYDDNVGAYSPESLCADSWSHNEGDIVVCWSGCLAGGPCTEISLTVYLTPVVVRNYATLDGFEYY